MEDAVDTLMGLVEKLRPEQAEAYWSKNRVITVRIALNDIVEAKVMTVEGVSVRLVVNKSIGFSSTTDLSLKSLQRTTDEAYRAAKSKSADPDFRSLPESSKVPELAGLDRSLLSLDLEEAVGMGYDALKTMRAEGKGLDLSGSVNAVSEACRVRNSLGLDASDSSAFIYSSFTVEDAEESSALGQDCSRVLKTFDPSKQVTEAIESIERSRNARFIQKGEYDVVFGPHAVAELAEYVLAYGLDLSAVDVGFSYFRGMLGKTVAGEDFTILDDGRHPEGIASKSIDDEGVPTETTALINRGVLQNFLCDSYYAGKLSSPLREFRSTGNGFRFGPVPGRDYSSLPRIQPTNLVIKPGNQPFSELIEDTRKGLLIGRIWYSYPINPTVGEFSTTNRGDTFSIENGEAVSPVLPNSFRINDNLPRLLKQIRGISREQVQSVVWGGVSSCISPYIKFGDVNVSYSKG